MSKRYETALTPGEQAALPDAAVDTSDIPLLDAASWRGARVAMPGPAAPADAPAPGPGSR